MADRFMARQPIFDSRLKVFGYELLFRAGPENVFRPGESPADEVIVNSTMLHDVKQLVGNALAFINVDYAAEPPAAARQDRKSTRLNSSHQIISYAVFCLKKKKEGNPGIREENSGTDS